MFTSYSIVWAWLWGLLGLGVATIVAATTIVTTAGISASVATSTGTTRIRAAAVAGVRAVAAVVCGFAFAAGEGTPAEVAEVAHYVLLFKGVRSFQQRA